MSCPIILASGARKHHSCDKPIEKGGVTCSLHKNRASEIPPTILPCTLENFEQLINDIAKGDFEKDAVIDLLDQYPPEVLAPFGIIVSPETEPMDVIFCRLFRWTHPHRSIKIYNGIFYLSDPHKGFKPTQDMAADLPVLTLPMWRTIVKELDKPLREQLKEDLDQMDPSDIGTLLTHYELKLDGFKWDTATVYRVVKQHLCGSK